jgi:hypothetical protein
MSYEDTLGDDMRLALVLGGWDIMTLVEAITASSRVAGRHGSRVVRRANSRVHPMPNTDATFVQNGEPEILPARARDPSMAPLEAEKRLMLAVLQRAVDDFRTYATVPTGRGRWLFMEVDAWFHSSASGPFDFEGICQASGLDPDFIREGLRNWYGLQRTKPVVSPGKGIRSALQSTG